MPQFYVTTTNSPVRLVSYGQTAFFLCNWVGRKKGLVRFEYLYFFWHTSRCNHVIGRFIWRYQTFFPHHNGGTQNKYRYSNWILFSPYPMTKRKKHYGQVRCTFWDSDECWASEPRCFFYLPLGSSSSCSKTISMSYLINFFLKQCI